MQSHTLNARFVPYNQLKFVTGQGGFLNAAIDNDFAGVTVSLYWDRCYPGNPNENKCCQSTFP